MKNQSPPDAWIERNPYDEQHAPDEGVYDQFPNQSLDTGTESPNQSTERGEAFKRYKGEYGQLKQGTKVWCNGYDGVIVRHYNGAMYEIRVPGGVVATDDFELVDKDFMFQMLVEEQEHRSRILDTINAAVASQNTAQPLTLDQTESFCDYLDNQGDSLAAPTSFDEWLAQNSDSLE